MRDPETIKAAITLAETGHLVLSTLHTNDTVQSIDRIVDVFPSGQQDQIRMQLAMSLVGIISQRLLPRTDKE
jgi:twitching motility protein PilT